MNQRNFSNIDIENNLKAFAELMTYEDLVVMQYYINKNLIKKKDKPYSDYFVCPITKKVLLRKSGKKIIMSEKITRYDIQTSYIYLSRKAYNKIINNK